MIQNLPKMQKEKKQRITAFVDPILVKRAKVRGALEGLTISEIIEKALDAHTPQIEEGADQHIHIKFIGAPVARTLIPKHTKHLVPPRQ